MTWEIASVLVAGMLSGGSVITAAIIAGVKYFPPKEKEDKHDQCLWDSNLNTRLGNMSERLGKVEQGHASLEASTEANYGHIMRRLDSHETKLDELLKRE